MKTTSLRKFHYNRVATLSVLLLLASGWQNAAASDWTIHGELNSDFNLPPYQFNYGYFNYENSPNPRGDEIHYDAYSTYPGNAHVNGNVVVSTGPGVARMDADITWERDYHGFHPENYTRFTAIGLATLTITDFTITGPGGAVTTNISLHLSGSVNSGASFSGGSNGIGASSGISLSLLAANNSIGAGSYASSASGGAPPVLTSSGWLQNFDGDDVLKSDNFTVDANTPFTVVFNLAISADAIMNDDNDGLAIAAAHFGNTLSFATDRPVFDLPDGYTVNSVSGGIVNNHFVLVPEPSTSGLLLLGAVVAVATGARVRSRRSPQTS